MERVAGGVVVAASGGAFVGHGAGTKMRAKNEWMRMIWPPTVKFASVRLCVKHDMCSRHFNSSVSALPPLPTNKEKPWHHLNKKEQRRLLRSLAP